ncbi:hypothetical protein N7507_011058 [Penicillium longicatenatum]|nr:hypothetical protein N7507_011058 [Penicillium longicatenatum]
MDGNAMVDSCSRYHGLKTSRWGVLDDVDTELVVLQAVTGQNLPREAYWHIRGTRRVGVCKEYVQMVCDCVWKGVSALCTRIRPNPVS